MFTPKQRMLNAYKGILSDRLAVAPEFWCYYPAKVLGVSMVEFEREIPFWKALQTTFKKYGTEGWGAAFPEVHNDFSQKKSKFEKLSGTQYRETVTNKLGNNEFVTIKMFDENEPSWIVNHMAQDESNLSACIDFVLSKDNSFDFSGVNKAHTQVGEDYLLEMWMGTPFFDFIAEIMGFENAIIYFADEDEKTLEHYRERYTEYQTAFIRKACENTQYE